jgi:hypothetical protein
MPYSPVPNLPQSAGYPDCLLHELQSASLPEALITVTHTFQPWLLSSLPPFDIIGGFPPCTQVWRLLNMSAPYAIATFQSLPISLPERQSFWFLVQHCS